MITKFVLILAVTGAAIVSLHQINGHIIGIDSVKDKGVDVITAVKIASDKISSAATVPLELIKKKTLHAAKIPIALAKKKLAAGLALKKVKIIAPVLLFKAAKKAIEAKIGQKKLKLAALKAALTKKIALAKLLKLAKIPILLWKLKLPIIAVKKTLKAHHTKKFIAWKALEHAAKLATLKTFGSKGTLLNKLSASKPLTHAIPVPVIEKGTDLGLSALLSGSLPIFGSPVNNEKEHQIPDIIYQLIPNYTTQYKNVQIVPKKEVFPSSSSSSSSFGDSSDSLTSSQTFTAEEPSLFGLPRL